MYAGGRHERRVRAVPAVVRGLVAGGGVHVLPRGLLRLLAVCQRGVSGEVHIMHIHTPIRKRSTCICTYIHTTYILTYKSVSPKRTINSEAFQHTCAYLHI